MTHVYIIQSQRDGKYYYGLTTQSVEQRLKDHNSGKSFYTKKFRPWKIVWYGAFSSKEKAENFERYLKTPSGHAFSHKRFI